MRPFKQTGADMPLIIWRLAQEKLRYQSHCPSGRFRWMSFRPCELDRCWKRKGRAMRHACKPNTDVLLQLLAFPRPLGRGKHVHGSLQGKVQDGFRSQLDLLALGCGLYAAAKSTACRSSYARSFTATGDSADDGADCSSGSYFRRGVFAARGAGA